MRVITAFLVTLFLFAVAAPYVAAQPPAAQSTLRFIHAAPDLAGLDLFVDGQLMLSSRDYFSASQSLPLSPGRHEVLVVPTGQRQANALSGEIVNLATGQAVTVLMLGDTANPESVLLEDKMGKVEPDEARIRFIHAAEPVGPLDIRLPDAQEPFLRNATFGSAAYVDVPVGSYALDLMVARSTRTLLRTLPMRFEAGWTYTLVITGDTAENLWVQPLIDRVGS